MGRSLFCSTCKKEKEPGRDNESRCKRCKADAYRLNRSKKREALGLSPKKKGRSLYCYQCHTLKENPKSGYCYKCARDRNKDWRLKKGITKNSHRSVCKCGAELSRYRFGLCSGCASKWRKEYLDNNPEIKAKIYKRQNRSKYDSYENFLKYVARYMTKNAVARGIIKKMPCKVCGIEEVDVHHEDYEKPLQVTWLCKIHHVERHKELLNLGD